MLTSLASRRAPAPDLPELIAFCIVERTGAPPAWVRCGSARVHPDGSVKVHLDALPLSGELHLRPPVLPTTHARTAPVARPAGQPLHS